MVVFCVVSACLHERISRLRRIHQKLFVLAFCTAGVLYDNNEVTVHERTSNKDESHLFTVPHLLRLSFETAVVPHCQTSPSVSFTTIANTDPNPPLPWWYCSSNASLMLLSLLGRLTVTVIHQSRLHRSDCHLSRAQARRDARSVTHSV